MSKLSIIILTDRTDSRFEKAVQSAEFADEVLVVLNNGAQLDKLPYEHLRILQIPGKVADFSAVRNQAITQATSEWVFMLDSDEVFPSNAAQVLSEAINSPNVVGGIIVRQDTFHNQPLRWGEAGKMPLLRLAKRNELTYQRPVHEVAMVTGAPIHLPLVLEHLAHTSISEFWSAICRYSRLEALHRKEKGHTFSLWQLCLYPPAKFIGNYFGKAGFLDGWRGLVYAFVMSCHSLMVRVYLYEATR